VQDQSDIITITGTKEGIEKAEHEIRVISDEQVILKKKIKNYKSKIIIRKYIYRF